MSDSAKRIAKSLEKHGGFLRCEVCGHVRGDLDTSYYIKRGWPTHCGYTMRWWTQRQIVADEVPSL